MAEEVEVPLEVFLRAAIQTEKDALAWALDPKVRATFGEELCNRVAELAHDALDKLADAIERLPTTQPDR